MGPPLGRSGPRQACVVLSPNRTSKGSEGPGPCVALLALTPFLPAGDREPTRRLWAGLASAPRLLSREVRLPFGAAPAGTRGGPKPHPERKTTAAALHHLVEARCEARPPRPARPV